MPSVRSSGVTSGRSPRNATVFMPELGSDATDGMNAWIVLPQTSDSNSRRDTGNADEDTWSDPMRRSQADNHGLASGR
jgi:hypothetical protein